MSAPTPADYVRAGYVLVPIPHVKGRPVKGPRSVGWNLEENAIRTVEQAELLDGNINIGLAHLWSRTCCIDVDDYLLATAWLSKRGIALDAYLAAEDAVQIVSGRPNRAKLCFRLPDGVVLLPHVPSNGRGFELRCASKDGKTLQDCLPPSIHEDTGQPYTWKGDWSNFPVLPEEILALWRELANGPRPSPGRSEGGKVQKGDRNAFLLSLAGSLRRKGVGEGAIRAALLIVNKEEIEEPLPDAEVVGVAKSVMRYPPAEAPREPPAGTYEEEPAREVPPLGAYAEDVQQRLLPSPSNPMAVSRKLIEEKYDTTAGRTLINHRGDFFRWDGICWPERDKLDVRRDAYVFVEGAICLDAKGKLQPFSPTFRKINDLIDALRACVGIASENEPPVWLDGRATPRASEIISMQNGLLHLPTRTVLPHTPRFFTHHALAFPYVAEAPEPVLWMEFLRQLWPDDPSSIDALQEVFGYVIGGDTRQQKIILFITPPRGGKGTVGRVLTGILGRHNVAAPTLASLSTNFGLAPLIGKPLALISDARLSGKADAKVVVERLLSISGEDSLTIDRKYRETWTGRLPSRFLVLTNELPQLADASGALSSRFVVLVGSTSFLDREDPGLTDKLLTEAPSILRWALEGLDRLNNRGYFVMPESGRDAVQQLQDLASPVAAFVRERCTVRPDASVEVDVLWGAWKEWCDGQGRGRGTKAVFGRDLHAAFPRVKKSRPRDGAERQHRYEGISVATTLDNCYDHRDHYDQTPAAGHSGHGGHGNSPMYRLQNDSPTDAEPTDEDVEGGV